MSKGWLGGLAALVATIMLYGRTHTTQDEHKHKYSMEWWMSNAVEYNIFYTSYFDGNKLCDNCSFRRM